MRAGSKGLRFAQTVLTAVSCPYAVAQAIDSTHQPWHSDGGVRKRWTPLVNLGAVMARKGFTRGIGKI